MIFQVEKFHISNEWLKRCTHTQNKDHSSKVVIIHYMEYVQFAYEFSGMKVA